MQEFSFIPVGEEYVRNYIEHLNPRKSVGVDNISSKLLKISSEVILDKITRLINFFIEKEAWPIEWKSGNITPVLKQKCDDTDKSNYRPMSVLTTLSKIDENIMYDQVYNAFQPHFSSNLSGYLKGHSCCSALFKMTEDFNILDITIQNQFI